MKLIIDEVRDVGRRLAEADAGRDRGGRLVMVIAANAGEGASSVAASLALSAGEGARKPVWLLDLDLMRNHAFNTFAVGALSNRCGGVGTPYSALLRTEPFFVIEPGEPGLASAPGLFTAHQIGETRVMVTQFDAGRLKPNAVVRVRPQPPYWSAVRGATEWTFVDAPALGRSAAGLVVAAQMDAVVLVVQADRTPAADVVRLADAVRRHGGAIAGVVMTHVKGDARALESLA